MRRWFWEDLFYFVGVSNHYLLECFYFYDLICLCV